MSITRSMNFIERLSELTDEDWAELAKTEATAEEDKHYNALLERNTDEAWNQECHEVIVACEDAVPEKWWGTSEGEHIVNKVILAAVALMEDDPDELLIQPFEERGLIGQ